ncbi:uncharacterized protein PV09_03657 [Verruconis gallopava]|uniref:Uncharacterized protein n=1 Tax=Verruconis gallopava TaxID=253628 RepID=A0A0D2AF50_9PEZI|nr:uncharacterized protein PV09_03657 [Verruconis gallopava]KIW05100.1 hypothetical protein PV09_03657 [Verruconis gallopava]
MAAELCCTAPRSMTPPEPTIKRRLRLANTHISAGPTDGTDSHHMTARSENLREIQRLFEANTINALALPPGPISNDLSTFGPKHSKLKSFFRRHLSLSLSKPVIERGGPKKNRDIKNEIRTNLLTDRGPDSGGYDSDAAVLENADEPPTPEKDRNAGAPQARSETRHHTVEHCEPNVNRRSLPMPLALPQLSFNSQGLRRSRSMTSIPSLRGTPEQIPMRLPSFSSEKETSHTWKRGVMQSLNIDSPSIPQLVSTPVRQSGQSELDHATSPMRETILATDSRLLTVQESSTFSHPPSESGSLPLTGTRPSEDCYSHADTKTSFERRLASRYGSCSSSSGARPHFFMRPERRPNRSSAVSLHLYSMGISQHLRSTSSFSISEGRNDAVSNPLSTTPFRSLTPPKKRNKSSPSYESEELPPLPPSGERDTGSSTYSSKSRISKRSDVLIRTIEYDEGPNDRARTPHSTDLPTAAMPKSDLNKHSSSQAYKPGLPNNPSISNLSEMSTKSSKVSRFREDFEIGDKKRSKKRASIVNLFNQLTTNPLQRRKNGSVESLDGPLDEPMRLQQAMALSERNDAAGLLAKAIRDKQVEKSALYLSDNKQAAQYEVFRQRSSSFGRPKGEPHNDENQSVDADQSHVSREWHHRSNHGTLQDPDAPTPNSYAPSLGPTLLNQCTRRLTSDFITPVFSHLEDLTVEQQRSQIQKKSSKNIDPTSVDNVEHESNLQLNGVHASLKISGLAIASGRAESIYTSISNDQIVDLDDPNLDLGPWSRYPSHTRDQRTGSAGIKDHVKTRDFAYNVNPLNINNDPSGNDCDSSRLKKRGKNKRRAGTLPKSKSMIISKGLRNYAKMFTRSSSTEFFHYGKGHRSSISTGGHLEYPELEILPPVFAPIPIIPDRRSEEEEAEEKDGEDSGLAPGKDEIEMKQTRLRRADHDQSLSDFTMIGPSRLDGPTDAKETDATARELGETCPIASSPALVSRLTAEDGTVATSALTYARDYESCVRLPPSTSHSTTSCQFKLLQDGDFHCHSNLDFSNSPDEYLIDKMLALQPASVHLSPLPSPLDSPLLAPKQSMSESANQRKYEHRMQSKSISSVTSLRASSMDLLKTLKEAEERERKRTLEDLLSKTSDSFSNDRKASADMNTRSAITERAHLTASEYDVPGVLGSKHQTWPEANRGKSTTIEAR